MAWHLGKYPTGCLEDTCEKHEPAFSFTATDGMFTSGEKCRLPCPFNHKNEDQNADDVYSRLAALMFGKGVAWDVPNPVFLEQKKILKVALGRLGGSVG